MSSDETDADDPDRAVTVESEAYNWAANGGTAPPDGEYVAEFERFVETGSEARSEAAALSIYEDEADRSEPVGRAIVDVPDVPHLAPDGDEHGGAFYVDVHDGRITDLTFDEELTAIRTADLRDAIGSNGSSGASEAVDTELVDHLVGEGRDEED